MLGSAACQWAPNMKFLKRSWWAWLSDVFLDSTLMFKIQPYRLIESSGNGNNGINIISWRSDNRGKCDYNIRRRYITFYIAIDNHILACLCHVITLTNYIISTITS